MKHPNDFNDKGTPVCRDVDDPDIFFPEINKRGYAEVTNIAKTYCATCPYIQECFEWAMANDEPGVWGGTSEQERRRMKRRMAGRVRHYSYGSSSFSATRDTP